ncbi:hypothetical protein C1S79_19630 [Mycolicibacterium phocaicum]|uniref:Uncharacterized protein n=1 Tax=Mycolicibacterium phocaicum TaxID=319706 RepID=A0AA94RBR4_9MYCO|nr:hypothetical protein C1S79_19630 [Mycolicibacterium phocaicum]
MIIENLYDAFLIAGLCDRHRQSSQRPFVYLGQNGTGLLSRRTTGELGGEHPPFQVPRLKFCVDRIHVGTAKPIEIDKDDLAQIRTNLAVQDLPRSKTMLSTDDLVVTDCPVRQKATCMCLYMVWRNMRHRTVILRLYEVTGDARNCLPFSPPPTVR